MTTALIAEDEALLADSLRELLEQVWPELQLVGTAADGQAAIDLIDEHRPQVVFLDIRMPRKSGLEVAQALAQGPQTGGAYAPLVVFVTAYDQYAIEAFESAAADYLLKPVSEPRLRRCVERLRARLADGSAAGTGGDASAPQAGDALADLRALMQTLAGQLPNTAESRPRFIRASLGDVIRQIPVDEVLYLEAQDKYVAVVTRDATALVRTPLAELLATLDPQRFVQIHRSTVVRVDAIDTIRRDLTGRQYVHLREKAGGREVKLPVSRQYAAQFRGQ